MQEYVFSSFFPGLLEDGKSFTAHLGKIITFPSIDKGTYLLGKPSLLGTPVAIFEGFVAALGG